MKAWVVTRYGAPEVMDLRNLPVPRPGPGEVLVRVRAIGVNFADLFARMGVYPGTPPVPFVPGLEFAGEVDGTRREGGQFAIGTAVMGYSRHGSHAEFVAVPESLLIQIPPGMSFESAAAFPAATMTAYHGLVRLANLRRGEKLLVHAAAGGVGLATVQLGHFIGAEVFATAGSDEKLCVAREQGAGHLINYRSEDFAGEVLRVTHGYGVDVVMDSVGGAVFRKSWALLAEMGRYVLFGVASVAGTGGLNRWKALGVYTRMLPIFPGSLISANKGIFGFNLGTLTAKEHYFQEAMGEVLRFHHQGALRPVVGKTFAFADAVQAHRFLQSRQSTGKVVITLHAD
jgi:NADPH:quinone reductase-like Zn-dependent oxidoreductase